MIKKSPKILYFVNGSMPSVLDIANAAELGNNVAFRNADFVNPDDKPESCAGVAGVVPSNYKKVPKGSAVYKKFLAEQKEYIAELKKAKEAAKAEKKKAAERKVEPNEGKDKPQPEPPKPENAPGWKPNK